jgi:hypothetical protein
MWHVPIIPAKQEAEVVGGSHTVQAGPGQKYETLSEK